MVRCKQIVRFVFGVCLFLSSNSVLSAGFIGADNWQVRQDLFTLANAGVISSTVTSFPISWEKVYAELNRTKADMFPNSAVKHAHQRLLKKYEKQNKALNYSFSLKAISKSPYVTTETDVLNTNASLTVAVKYAQNGLHAVADLQVLTSPIERFDQKKLEADTAFVGYELGNWLLSVGYIKHKFGPGNDTQLFRSVNAQSPPSFYISRVSDEAFETPWLSWIGPWTFIHGVSVLDDDRAISDALLWTMRASFRPFDFVEFGVSKAAQLCGEDKSCDVSQWRKTLSGDTNVTSGENPANQVAGVDLRFSGLLLDTPFELYWESVGEDAVRLTRYPPFQAKSHLYGGALDLDFGRLFVEYSDTGARCTGGVLNCTYEHSAYRSGYRYKYKTFGSTYDNDTKAFVLGVRSQIGVDHYVASHVRLLDQNYDDTNAGAPGGNPIAPVREKSKQLDVIYGFPLKTEKHLDFGVLELGGELTKREQDDDHGVRTSLWFSWHRDF